VKQMAEVVGMFAVLIGSSVATGSNEWTWFFVSIAGSLGISEYAVIKTKGKSLSQIFGDMETKKKGIMSGGMIGFVALLLHHLWTM